MASGGTDPSQWGIAGSLVLVLLGVGRALMRWERLLTQAAKEEIVDLRAELDKIRSHVTRCEDDNERLRGRVSELERIVNMEHPDA